MACWKDEMVFMLRTLINDLDSNPTNSDENLVRLLAVAAMQVQSAVDFDTIYSITVGDPSITPDPSTGNRDDDFMTLVCMKAACMIARAEQKDKARMGMMIKDGPANIDGRNVGSLTAKWADNICQDYSKAELQFRLGNRIAGQAIISPYRFEGSRYGTDPRGDNRDSYTGTFY